MVKGMILEFKISVIVGVLIYWILIGFFYEFYFSKIFYVNNIVFILLNVFISMFMVFFLNSVNLRKYYK